MPVEKNLKNKDISLNFLKAKFYSQFLHILQTGNNNNNTNNCIRISPAISHKLYFMARSKTTPVKNRQKQTARKSKREESSTSARRPAGAEEAAKTTPATSTASTGRSTPAVRRRFRPGTGMHLFITSFS